MSGTLESLRALAGDALIAAGEAVRGAAEVWPAEYTPAAPVTPDAIPRDEVCAALAELDDSQLVTIAATIIAGWKPILLKTTGHLTDVDALVEELRARAAIFAAVERDADEPHLTPARLRLHLTD